MYIYIYLFIIEGGGGKIKESMNAHRLNLVNTEFS